MWMEVEKLAECVDDGDHSRRRVPAVQDGAVDLDHRPELRDVEDNRKHLAEADALLGGQQGTLAAPNP